VCFSLILEVIHFPVPTGTVLFVQIILYEFKLLIIVLTAELTEV
tara:strand:- start:736 stop:867 length:132 start_codon:yes stop_codon:yes gene_type:complete